MAHTISIDVVDMTIPEGNNRNIPIVNKPNPCMGYDASAAQVKYLIQLSNYNVYAAGTKKTINGNNFYDYFPEEQPGGGGGGGGVTPAQVEAMIANSIDAAVSSTSKNAIQNKVIKKYVDDNVNGKQPALNETQMNAVNSGITAMDVSQITTNTNDISSINNIIGDINDTLEEVL